MDLALDSPCFADAPPIAGEVARGVTRLFCRRDLFSICEVPLPNGRRADMMAIDPKGEFKFNEAVSFQVNCKDQAEIDYYLKNYKPFDKAGSYGIQEWIGYIGIEKIEGSYFNVMGLPTKLVYKTLSEIADR